MKMSVAVCSLAACQYNSVCQLSMVSILESHVSVQLLQALEEHPKTSSSSQNYLTPILTPNLSDINPGINRTAFTSSVLHFKI
ncbi:MAG: hypothetical protein MJE68_31020, partial [Proteobacteria bacterium]|nr:hypothetical protein [Pseudomonadota bacterium]